MNSLLLRLLFPVMLLLLGLYSLYQVYQIPNPAAELLWRAWGATILGLAWVAWRIYLWRRRS